MILYGDIILLFGIDEIALKISLFSRWTKHRKLNLKKENIKMTKHGDSRKDCTIKYLKKKWKWKKLK